MIPNQFPCLLLQFLNVCLHIFRVRWAGSLHYLSPFIRASKLGTIKRRLSRLVLLAMALSAMLSAVSHTAGDIVHGRISAFEAGKAVLNLGTVGGNPILPLTSGILDPGDDASPLKVGDLMPYLKVTEQSSLSEGSRDGRLSLATTDDTRAIFTALKFHESDAPTTTTCQEHHMQVLPDPCQGRSSKILKCRDEPALANMALTYSRRYIPKAPGCNHYLATVQQFCKHADGTLDVHLLMEQSADHRLVYEIRMAAELSATVELQQRMLALNFPKPSSKPLLLDLQTAHALIPTPPSALTSPEVRLSAEVCCGISTLTELAKRHGYHSLGCLDIKSQVLHYSASINRVTHSLRQDIFKLNYFWIVKRAGLFLLCPPCQPFSGANVKRQGMDDPSRGLAIWAGIGLIMKCSGCPVGYAEEVQAMAFNGNGEVTEDLRTLNKLFFDIGLKFYVSKHKELKHAVQSRARIGMMVLDAGIFFDCTKWQAELNAMPELALTLRDFGLPADFDLHDPEEAVLISPELTYDYSVLPWTGYQRIPKNMTFWPTILASYSAAHLWYSKPFHGFFVRQENLDNETKLRFAMPQEVAAAFALSRGKQVATKAYILKDNDEIIHTSAKIATEALGNGVIQTAEGAKLTTGLSQITTLLFTAQDVVEAVLHEAIPFGSNWHADLSLTQHANDIKVAVTSNETTFIVVLRIDMSLENQIDIPNGYGLQLADQYLDTRKTPMHFFMRDAALLKVVPISSKIELFVKHGLQLKLLHLPIETTIADLRLNIQDVNTRLHYGRYSDLRDHRTLAFYNIQEYGTVHTAIRVKGGSDDPGDRIVGSSTGTRDQARSTIDDVLHTLATDSNRPAQENARAARTALMQMDETDMGQSLAPFTQRQQLLEDLRMSFNPGATRAPPFDMGTIMDRLTSNLHPDERRVIDFATVWLLTQYGEGAIRTFYSAHALPARGWPGDAPSTRIQPRGHKIRLEPAFSGAPVSIIRDVIDREFHLPADSPAGVLQLLVALMTQSPVSETYLRSQGSLLRSSEPFTPDGPVADIIRRLSPNGSRTSTIQVEHSDRPDDGVSSFFRNHGISTFTREQEQAPHRTSANSPPLANPEWNDPHPIFWLGTLTLQASPGTQAMIGRVAGSVVEAGGLIEMFNHRARAEVERGSRLAPYDASDFSDNWFRRSIIVYQMAQRAQRLSPYDRPQLRGGQPITLVNLQGQECQLLGPCDNGIAIHGEVQSCTGVPIGSFRLTWNGHNIPFTAEAIAPMQVPIRMTLCLKGGAHPDTNHIDLNPLSEGPEAVTRSNEQDEPDINHSEPDWTKDFVDQQGLKEARRMRDDPRRCCICFDLVVPPFETCRCGANTCSLACRDEHLWTAHREIEVPLGAEPNYSEPALNETTADSSSAQVITKRSADELSQAPLAQRAKSKPSFHRLTLPNHPQTNTIPLPPPIYSKPEGSCVYKFEYQLSPFSLQHNLNPTTLPDVLKIDIVIKFQDYKNVNLLTTISSYQTIQDLQELFEDFTSMYYNRTIPRSNIRVTFASQAEPGTSTQMCELFHTTAAATAKDLNIVTGTKFVIAINEPETDQSAGHNANRTEADQALQAGALASSSFGFKGGQAIEVAHFTGRIKFMLDDMQYNSDIYDHVAAKLQLPPSNFYLTCQSRKLEDSSDLFSPSCPTLQFVLRLKGGGGKGSKGEGKGKHRNLPLEATWETTATKQGLLIDDLSQLTTNDEALDLNLCNVPLDHVIEASTGYCNISMANAIDKVDFRTDQPFVYVINGYRKDALIGKGFLPSRLFQTSLSYRDPVANRHEPRTVTVYNCASDTSMYLELTDSVADGNHTSTRYAILVEMKKDKARAEDWKLAASEQSFRDFVARVVETAVSKPASMHLGRTYVDEGYASIRLTIEVADRDPLYSRSGINSLIFKQRRNAFTEREQGLEVQKLFDLQPGSKNLHDTAEQAKQHKGFLGLLCTASAVLIRISDASLGSFRSIWFKDDPRFNKDNQDIKCIHRLRVTGFREGTNFEATLEFAKANSLRFVPTSAFTFRHLVTCMGFTDSYPPQLRYNSPHGPILIEVMEKPIIQKAKTSKPSTHAPNTNSYPSLSSSSSYYNPTPTRPSAPDALTERVNKLEQQMTTVQTQQQTTIGELQEMKSNSSKQHGDVMAMLSKLVKTDDADVSSPTRKKAKGLGGE